MRVYINPENILELGIKIFVDGNLIKEIIVKRGVNIAYFDISDEIKGTLSFELSDPDQIENPACINIMNQSSEKRKAIFSDQCGDTDIIGRKALGFLYPYRTILAEWDNSISEIYCGFVSLGDLDVGGIIVYRCRKNGKIEPYDYAQTLERIPSVKDLKRKKRKYMCIFLLLILMMVPVVLFHLNWVLSAEVDDQFEGRSNFALAYLCVAPLSIIPYYVYYISKGTLEVLNKCDKVPAHEVLTSFESEYYKKQTEETNKH